MKWGQWCYSNETVRWNNRDLPRILVDEKTSRRRSLQMTLMNSWRFRKKIPRDFKKINRQEIFARWKSSKHKSTRYKSTSTTFLAIQIKKPSKRAGSTQSKNKATYKSHLREILSNFKKTLSTNSKAIQNPSSRCSMRATLLDSALSWELSSLDKSISHGHWRPVYILELEWKRSLVTNSLKSQSTSINFWKCRRETLPEN